MILSRFAIVDKMRSAAELCRQRTESKLDASVIATGAVAMMLFAGTVNTGPDGGEIKLQFYSLVTYHILFLASSLQYSFPFK